MSNILKGGIELPNGLPDLEEMMNKYGDNILRICYIYLKDRHLAEDAFQETFIMVYRKYNTFKGESSEITWIMRIAINICKNHLRTSWLKRVVLMDQSAFENYIVKAEEYERPMLLEEIMKLKPIYKEVIFLFYYLQLNVAEIANVLKTKESTITVRLSRARDQLKYSIERGQELGYER